jgi:ankyrin repeat protein
MEMNKLTRAILDQDLVALEPILQERPENANYEMTLGLTILDRALYFGFYDVCVMIHKYGGRCLKSALYNATFSNNLRLIKWVYDIGLDTNVNNPQLYLGAMSNRKTSDANKMETVVLLVSSGADFEKFVQPAIMLSPLTTKMFVNQGKFDGSKHLQYIRDNQLKNPLLLYDLPDKSNSIFVAITNNDDAFIITNKNNYNFNELCRFDNTVGTPLHYSFRCGNLPIIKLIYESFKADPNVKVENGYTCVSYSVYSNDYEIIKYAREISEPNASNAVHTDGTTVLFNALNNMCKLNVFKGLFVDIEGKSKPDPNVRGKWGDLPVTTLAALKRGNKNVWTDDFEIFKLLKKNGAEIDVYEPSVRTTPRAYYASIRSDIAALINAVTA